MGPMWVDEVVTYLEMTAPEQLRPASGPTSVELRPEPADSPLLHGTYVRVATPHHWGHLAWSEREWRERQGVPQRRHWLILAGDEPAGMLSLEAQPEGQVEILSFGLVPEFVGQGHGGAALTESVRLAWSMPPLDTDRVRRVWLHTSSLDHPHARTNYERRGFRPFRTETRRREIPG
jgi:RimJ/RimL family protein N-acetyltransferase